MFRPPARRDGEFRLSRVVDSEVLRFLNTDDRFGSFADMQRL